LIKCKINSTCPTRRNELAVLPIEKQQSKWTIKSYYSVNAKDRKNFCFDNNPTEGLIKKIRSHLWKRVSATVTIIQGGVHVQARFAKNLQISLVWPSHQFCYKKHDFSEQFYLISRSVDDNFTRTDGVPQENDRTYRYAHFRGQQILGTPLPHWAVLSHSGLPYSNSRVSTVQEGRPRSDPCCSTDSDLLCKTVRLLQPFLCLMADKTKFTFCNYFVSVSQIKFIMNEIAICYRRILPISLSVTVSHKLKTNRLYRFTSTTCNFQIFWDSYYILYCYLQVTQFYPLNQHSGQACKTKNP